MDNKIINKQIRRISNRASILLVIFSAVIIPSQFLLGYLRRTSEYGSVWRNAQFVSAITQASLFLFMYPLLFLLYYKWLNRENGLRLKSAFQKSRRSKGWVFKWTIIAIGCGQLPGILINMLINAQDTSVQSAALKNDPLSWIIYGVPLVLLAPIFEELLFRATIYRNNHRWDSCLRLL